MNNGLYEHIKAFIAIAQARSMTAASIAVGIGQTTLSRQLSELEQHLGCRLFQRSTRSIRLTEQGESFLKYALQLADLTEQAEAAMQQRSADLRGRLRVACSIGFGRRLLIPTLAEWQRQHPQVHLDLLLSDQISPVIEEGVDIAFRLGELKDSSLISRPLATFDRIVVATPDYLRRHGDVSHPDDLHGHQCLLYSAAMTPEHWRLAGPDGELDITVAGHVSLSSVDALYDAVLAGLGIAVMPQWFWFEELRDGRVQRLLPSYALPTQTIHAVMPSRVAAGSKVRVFSEFVETHLRQHKANLEGAA